MYICMYACIPSILPLLCLGDFLWTVEPLIVIFVGPLIYGASQVWHAISCTLYVFPDCSSCHLQQSEESESILGEANISRNDMRIVKSGDDDDVAAAGSENSVPGTPAGSRKSRTSTGRDATRERSSRKVKRN